MKRIRFLALVMILSAVGFGGYTALGLEPTFPNYVTMKNPESVENQWFSALFP